MPARPAALPPLDPILARLEAQLGAAPGHGRLTREDVLILAILARERESTRAWTVHRPDCHITRGAARWQQVCSCGLEAAEGVSGSLRRKLEGAPPELPPDPRVRGKRYWERG
jgi:hypothetical protein